MKSKAYELFSICPYVRHFNWPTWNADGSEGKTVIEIPRSNHFEYTYVTWSPDGTKLAFNGTINNSVEAENIYVINLDGTGLTQITSGNWWYAGPYWVK